MLAPEALEDLLAKRGPGFYDHAEGHRDYDRDVAAIAAISRVPSRVIGELLGAHDASAADRAAFLRDYHPPRGLDDVRETARALSAWLAGARGARNVIARVLLEEELRLFFDSELARLHQYAARGDVRAKSFARKLGL